MEPSSNTNQLDLATGCSLLSAGIALTVAGAPMVALGATAIGGSLVYDSLCNPEKDRKYKYFSAISSAVTSCTYSAMNVQYQARQKIDEITKTTLKGTGELLVSSLRYVQKNKALPLKEAAEKTITLAKNSIPVVVGEVAGELANSLTPDAIKPIKPVIKNITRCTATKVSSNYLEGKPLSENASNAAIAGGIIGGLEVVTNSLKSDSSESQINSPTLENPEIKAKEDFRQENPNDNSYLVAESSLEPLLEKSKTIEKLREKAIEILIYIRNPRPKPSKGNTSSSISTSINIWSDPEVSSRTKEELIKLAGILGVSAVAGFAIASLESYGAKQKALVIQLPVAPAVIPAAPVPLPPGPWSGVAKTANIVIRRQPAAPVAAPVPLPPGPWKGVAKTANIVIRRQPAAPVAAPVPLPPGPWNGVAKAANIVIRRQPAAPVAVPVLTPAVPVVQAVQAPGRQQPRRAQPLAFNMKAINLGNGIVLKYK